MNLAKLIFAFGGRQRFGDSPTQPKAAANCSLADANTFCPLGHIKDYSVMFQTAIVALIVGLIFPCCPTNVAGLVSFRVINSIKGVEANRTLSNFGEDFRDERGWVVPRFVQFNSAPAVNLVKCSVSIVATITNVMPEPVKIVRIAPAATVLGVDISRQAATRLNITALQVSACRNMLVSADTNTFPNIVALFVFAQGMECGQSAKTAASQILDFSPCFHAGFDYLSCA